MKLEGGPGGARSLYRTTVCHEDSSSTRRSCTTLRAVQGVGRAWVSGHVPRSYVSASRRGSIADPNAANCRRARAVLSIARRVPIENSYGRRCARRRRGPAPRRIPAAAATAATAQRPRGAAARVAAWRMWRILPGCPEGRARGVGAEAAHRARRRGVDLRQPAAPVAERPAEALPTVACSAPTQTQFQLSHGNGSRPTFVPQPDAPVNCPSNALTK